MSNSQIFNFFTADNPKNLAQLDGIRAIAILLVIFFHVFFFAMYQFDQINDWVNFSAELPFYLAWIRRGDFGVDLFFVLSGFLISSHLLKEYQHNYKINLKIFYRRRLLRIYPLYIFALALFVISKGWHNSVLANIFAVNNLFEFSPIVIPWSWSIAVEIQFYLIAPLLIILSAHKVRYYLWLALVLGSIMWLIYFSLSPELEHKTLLDIYMGEDKLAIKHYFQFLYVSPIARISGFVFGIIIAYFWVNKSKSLTQCIIRHNFISCMTVIFVVGLIITTFSQNTFIFANQLTATGNMVYLLNLIFARIIITACVAFLLLFSLLKTTGWVSTFLSLAIFHPIAKFSYSMYFFHPIFIFVSYQILFNNSKINSLSIGDLLLVTLMTTIGCFLFGIITYLTIEKRFIT